MSIINLWENPRLSENLRIQIASSEIERLKQELATARQNADHYENEWSDVCNENQKLINEINRLKGLQ